VGHQCLKDWKVVCFDFSWWKTTQIMGLMPVSQVRDTAKWVSSRLSGLQPSTTILLSSISLLVIGVWRHTANQALPAPSEQEAPWRYNDTEAYRSPLQQQTWIEWLAWIILLSVHKVFEGPAIATGVYMPQAPSFWRSRSVVWVACAAAVTSQFLPSEDVLSCILVST